MSTAAQQFWQELDRYHDLAREFARNIELEHPSAMNGRLRRCRSDDICCGWCATTVTYYEYSGPSV